MSKDNKSKLDRFCDKYPHLKSSKEGPVYYTTLSIAGCPGPGKPKFKSDPNNPSAFFEITDISLYVDKDATLDVPEIFEGASITIRKVSRAEGLEWRYRTEIVRKSVKARGYLPGTNLKKDKNDQKKTTD